MNQEELFEYVASVYKMTKQQVFIANELLSVLNERYNNYQYIEYFHYKKKIEEKYGFECTERDYDFAIDKLENEFSLIDKHYDDSRYQITLDGRDLYQEHSDFLEYLDDKIEYLIEKSKEQQEEKNLKSQIDNLTLKQLRGTIFQVNKWWLIVIINAFVSIGVAVLVAFLIKKLGF
ncbi:MAG: hypothetical protein KQH79_11445 [Bacteroidetes bacterium]|nr:hypothetical protein [Bacteroidota bacterium]